MTEEMNNDAESKDYEASSITHYDQWPYAKEIDAESLIKSFVDQNNSILSEKDDFLGLVATFFGVVLVGVTFFIIKFYTSELPSSALENAEVQSPIFWLYLAQRLGCVAILLAIIIPYFKLLSYVVKAALISREAKNKRYANAFRFIYILKYTGKVNQNDEIEPSIESIDRYAGKDTKSMSADDLAKILEMISNAGKRE